MNKYIIDFEVTGIEISRNRQSELKNVFLQITMDGTNEQIVSEPMNGKNWPLRAKKILQNLDDLSNAFLYCGLYSEKKQLIATSKVGFNSFPVGKPKKFVFPILSTENNAVVSANVSMQAMISAFFEIHQNPPYRNYNTAPFPFK